MATAFDDLIPERRDEAPPQARASAFADLIPAEGTRRDGPGAAATRDFGIDWSRPVPEVRAAIARLSAEERPAALRQWADAYVAEERGNRGRTRGLLGHAIDAVRGRPSDTGAVGDVVRQVARGTLVGPWADEANAYTNELLHRVTGGRTGAPYDESLAYQRATDRAIDRDQGHAGTALQVAGGLASGLPWLSIPKTLGGRMLMGGAVVGPIHGYVAGTGNSEADTFAGRQDEGITGAAIGAGIGAAIPAGLSGLGAIGSTVYRAASPTLARWGAEARDLPRRYGIHASADGGGPTTPGADAAAQQIIANQLLRSGRTVEELRNVYRTADEATLFNGGGPRGTSGPSYAQNVLAPVDLDPGLQRLASSVGRQSTEAGDIGETFLRTRQTGASPVGRPLEASAGLPHRPAFSRAASDDPPMGQYERMRDALKRAMLIKDADYHGHQANAYRTEQAMIAASKKEAKTLYGSAYQAGRNVNITEDIAPVLAQWARRLDDEPAPVAKEIGRAMRLFFTQPSGPPGVIVTSLERFDKAKQFLDGQIQNLFESALGRNRYLGGILTVFKNELLEAVDKNPRFGEAYAAARAAFGTNAEMREALNLGRAVFRENSDVVADQYRALSEGQQKLFRLGLLESFEQHMGRQKRAADVTQVFETPRIQDILNHVIPRTETEAGRVKASAVYGNRPERFGRVVTSEKQMIHTRNEVTGNSKTQQRAVDDEAFNAMNTLSSTFQKLRESGSPTAVVIQSIQSTLDKFFGFRADTAAAIARQLYTADINQIRRVFEEIERRMGPTRASVLTDAMRRMAQELGTPVAARQLPPATENR